MQEQHFVIKLYYLNCCTSVLRIDELSLSRLYNNNIVDVYFSADISFLEIYYQVRIPSLSKDCKVKNKIHAPEKLFLAQKLSSQCNFIVQREPGQV